MGDRRRVSGVTAALVAVAAAIGGCSAEPAARLFPPGVSWDYQLGGAYPPAEGIAAVVREVSDGPADGVYSICYVNAFQTQPGASASWLADGLVLTVDGEPLVDPDWPDEFLLDTGTQAKRTAIAERITVVLQRCADRGFDAVELDNLDSYGRSDGRLVLDDNRALATTLVAAALDLGLPVGQKNAAEDTAELAGVGFGFAIAEQCVEFGECGEYAAQYGDAVLAVEYPGPTADPCADGDRPASTVVRDRDLSMSGDVGYLFRTC
ncbi:endo alpha-1,4 polygalactosaminidase [Arthrobacter agilis]|uniref:endo alpha-1,4 polygalactosaminidase n=1 Tax=Arthrobacter agilis TaxID=37921 RepID=UPI0023655E79|nr:endo alpha-1,4 polygalactosaminidase [Arthrobacter agilis]WDF32727.1 endo alpha-1,4 polygalactosaminidase [Arthrobacter agilis]